MLFKEFVEHVFSSSTATNRPSTAENKATVLELHLVPFFGQRELGAIGYADTQDFVAHQLGKKYAPGTVRDHVGILRRFLVIAVKRGLLVALPEIEWPKVPDRPFRFLSFEEAVRLIEAAEPGVWRRMITVGLKTGLRIGELVGLTPDDVRLERGLLEVRRTVHRGHVNAPKNGRFRTIPLTTSALDALSFQLEEARARGSATLFATNPSTATDALARACADAAIARVGWHVLRHTFASHLTMRGVPIRIVQELLGHRRIEMTVRYTHLSPESVRGAVACLDEGRHQGKRPWLSARRRPARERAPAPSTSFVSPLSSTTRDRRPFARCDSASFRASE